MVNSYVVYPPKNPTVMIVRFFLPLIYLLISLPMNAQNHGAILFRGVPPGNQFSVNNIIEISDHEIVFDLRVDHAIDALWTEMVVDFMGKIDTLYNPYGGMYLMKANFKDRTLKAVPLRYNNFSTRNNIYLTKHGENIYFIDPEVRLEDSMMFVDGMKTFAIAKGPKVILARFDTDLNLIDFKDWFPTSESVIENAEEAVTIIDDLVFTENKKGTRKRYKIEHAIATASEQAGNPSYVTLMTKADRWGSVLDRSQHNQNGTFDKGLFVSANSEEITNQLRVYTINRLFEDLKVDTLGKFTSNAILSSICPSKSSKQKYVSGYFENTLLLNKAQIYTGVVRNEPYSFIASLNDDGSISDFTVTEELFSSITLSSIYGYPAINVVKQDGTSALEHYMIDASGQLSQKKSEFTASVVNHHFSVALSSGAIASSSLVSGEVNIDGNIYTSFDQMHVISLTDQMRPPRTSALDLTATLVTCDSIDLKWTSTGAEFYTILASLDTIPDFLPMNGVNYNYSPDYGKAYRPSPRTRILYQGTDTTLSTHAFISGKKYFFHVIEGEGVAGATRYDVDFRATASVSIAPSIWQDSLVISPSTDTAFCEGDVVGFLASGGSDYFWQNGSRGSEILISETDTVSFISPMPDGCLVSSDTVNSQRLAMPFLTDLFTRSNPPFCKGDTVRITGRSNLAYGYRWSTGDTLPTISVAESGWYQLTSQNQFCSVSDSIFINISEHPTYSFEQDTFDFLFGSLQSIGVTTTATQMDWRYLEEKGSSAPFKITANQSGYLVVEGAIDTPCYMSDSTFIQVFQPDSLIIPNAFSPNDDGLNDVWDIPSFYSTGYQVKVFDRWGELLYVGTETTGGWDGTKRGEKVPLGVYYYMVESLSDNELVTGSLFVIK